MDVRRIRMKNKIQKNGAMDFHVLPPHGLLNDPNGLVHFNGLTHVFFQWNTEGTDHSYKAWGHAVTEDFVHYTYYEPALLPDESYDKNGCYSGSALVHEGKLYLFYTGNVKNEEGERESYQCAAVSEDGFSFRKLGPVIGEVPGYTAHVRDPKVFRGEQGEFYMVLGAQREDLTGDTIAYRSMDLKNWEFLGSLLTEREELGYMWECPDLVRLGEKDVFLFSPQGLQEDGHRFKNIFQTGYYIGKFDFGRFHKEEAPFDELDRGFEFYAPQTFDMPDGRVLLIGWMGTMEKEKEEALPTLKEGWVHHLSIPRELRINAEGKVMQTPVRELLRFFKEENAVSGKDLKIGREGSFLLEVLNEYEAQSIRLRVSSDVELKLEDHWFTVERVSWLDGKKEIRQVPLPLGLKDLKIIGDHTSLEIFINGGEEVFSLRYFEDSSDSMVSLISSEAVTMKMSGFQKG